VGNENIGERKFALEFLQKQENLRADGDIERGNGFVGNDKLGPENQGGAMPMRCRWPPENSCG